MPYINKFFSHKQDFLIKTPLTEHSSQHMVLPPNDTYLMTTETGEVMTTETGNIMITEESME